MGRIRPHMPFCSMGKPEGEYTSSIKETVETLERTLLPQVSRTWSRENARDPEGLICFQSGPLFYGCGAYGGIEEDQVGETPVTGFVTD